MFTKILVKLLSHIIVENYENVEVYGPKGKRIVRAKVDSGANLTSIDKSVAAELGLLTEDNVVERRVFESGLGRQHRDIINFSFKMKDTKMKTIASVSNREHMAHKMIIGRQNLQGFLIRPSTIQEDKK